MTGTPSIDDLPAIPRDAEGPVFREPWEAQAFAMVVQLHQRGLFPWTQWAECLSREITAAQQRGDPDLGDTYFHHWFSALEKILRDCGVAEADADALKARCRELRAHWPSGHDHVARREPVAVA